MASIKTRSENGVKWLIDNGCSNHMSGDQRLLKNLESTPQHNIKLRDGNLLQVARIDTVVLKANSRKNYIHTMCSLCPNWHTIY